jgi:hypothetical protein
MKRFGVLTGGCVPVDVRQSEHRRIATKQRETTVDIHFVKVVDVKERVQILNTRHVVRVHQDDLKWRVVFTNGKPVVLDKSEAEKLFRRLSGLETKPRVKPAKVRAH